MGVIAGDELVQWEKAEGGGNGSGKEERILVSVRIRPLNAMELARSETSDWECINNTTIIFKNSILERSMFPSAYTLDRVFGCDCTTKQVYEEGAKEVALSVISGINSSIFAYGQTSSGKTYTMTGITEYSVADIYDFIQQHEEREFSLKFSAMEIYNESVRDLLSMDSTPLRLLDDPERGTVVEKLTEETLRDSNHLKELLSMCEAQRQIGETSLNEMSSRSHQILRLTIESSAREFLCRDNSSTLAASVNFVDLAGSERASQAMSAGTRLKEGCHINRSLLTLGTVIRKLSKGRNGHIPYRDSKLTRILQPFLGGNARTAIICTMSPARSHIEQSRNTLLFATCAKEVVINAQVNVVMSDKALVRHLQRELARLESELRYPGSASTGGQPEALREKDAQIKKMEDEIKELMHQRDLAQSRLEDFLRAVGDDQNSGQWEEVEQQSISHVPNVCADGRSVSETSGVAYQNLDLGLKSSCPSHWRNDSVEGCLQLFDQTIENHDISPRNSVSSPGFIGLVPYQEPEEIGQNAFEEIEDHCKEVRCIEMDERSAGRSEEFNLSLSESDGLLPPTLGDNEIGDIKSKPKRYVVSRSALERQIQSVKVDSAIESYPDEPSPWYTVKDSTSSRIYALSRIKSCRASRLSVPSSPWFQEAETNDKTPPSSFLKDLHKRPEALQRRPTPLNYGAEFEKLSIEGSQTSALSPCSDEVQVTKTASEEDITSICNFVEGLKEMAHIQCHIQLANNQDSKSNASEDFRVERTVKDVGVDPILNPLESPSRWPLEFEKKQKEIIKLWDACNVSLLHRTCFFLLIKGEPADSVYIEVEQRRLYFLKRTLSQGNFDRTTAADRKNSLSSSLRNLEREREMLCRQMLKRLSAKERESLYTKWGITLDSKQRKLQLACQLWTETEDMEHVRESASLVARLTGILEPGAALKEMFGLSFTLQNANRRSYSWKHGKSSFK